VGYGTSTTDDTLKAHYPNLRDYGQGRDKAPPKPRPPRPPRPPKPPRRGKD
jgi:hypothetical protein